MAEKNLFVKFNTGPSGHGAPVTAGEAMALKHAGAEGVKVFGFEGEGGHTAGCRQEKEQTKGYRKIFRYVRRQPNR